MNNIAKKQNFSKNSFIETPEWLVSEIWFRIREVVTDMVDCQAMNYPLKMADLCCGKGALTKEFGEDGLIDITGYDLKDHSEDYPHKFIQKNLLESSDIKNIYDIIVMNPPYNGIRTDNIVHLFLKSALERLDDDGFIVMLSPYHFFLDGDKRWKELNNTISVFKILPFPVHHTFRDPEDPGKFIHVHGAVLFICKKDAEYMYKDDYSEFTYLHSN